MVVTIREKKTRRKIDSKRINKHAGRKRVRTATRRINETIDWRLGGWTLLARERIAGDAAASAATVATALAGRGARTPAAYLTRAPIIPYAARVSIYIYNIQFTSDVYLWTIFIFSFAASSSDLRYYNTDRWSSIVDHSSGESVDRWAGCWFNQVIYFIGQLVQIVIIFDDR